MLEQTERRRLVVPLPWSVARLQGSIIGTLDRLTLGLMPDDFVITRDQVTLLERDNVVSEEAAREGRTLEGLGIVPTAFEAIVPSYMMRFRRRGQFDLKRNAAPSETPTISRRPAQRGPDPASSRGRASGPAARQGSAR